MARKSPLATRLPSGSYAWRGRAVPFSRLPAAERARFRSHWAEKAARTVRREAARLAKTLTKDQRDVLQHGQRGPPQELPFLRRGDAEALIAQRAAIAAYRRGDLEVGRRNWENRDRSKPAGLYYYHAKGRK